MAPCSFPVVAVTSLAMSLLQACVVWNCRTKPRDWDFRNATTDEKELQPPSRSQPPFPSPALCWKQCIQSRETVCYPGQSSWSETRFQVFRSLWDPRRSIFKHRIGGKTSQFPASPMQRSLALSSFLLRGVWQCWVLFSTSPVKGLQEPS